MRSPTQKDFDDWLNKNGAFVEDYALQHYLKLGRGAVTLHLNGVTNKSELGYLPAEAVLKALPDNNKMVAGILEEVARYNPDGQISYIFFANGSAISFGILQFRESSSGPLK